jgi:HlyD family secretion protein
MKAAVMLGCSLLALAGCNKPEPVSFQGYVEGEYVLVAAPFAGSLMELAVARGQRVEAGAPLFTLEQANEAAGKQEAEEKLRAAQARLENLRTGERAPELDALIAEARQAEAARDYSAIELKRSEDLFKQNFVSAARVDQDRTALRRDQARFDQAQAQLRAARQSLGRSAELASAQAEVDAARAVVAQAQWKLGQKTQPAPRSGLVNDTFFVIGEWVPAGRPVVSLLPPENVKVRFFVPEPVAGQIKLGQKVAANCDGCGAPIAATVSYVAPDAEYTPPVIYSKETRAKLVFMVEARLEAADAVRLKPGQPVDVTP